MNYRTDFSMYKFRCSQLGNLMTGYNPGLTESQQEQFDLFDDRYRGFGSPLSASQLHEYHRLGAIKTSPKKLSRTAISYLEKLHKEVVFQKKNELRTKYTEKGLMVEEKGISLYSEVQGKLFIKNTERRENEYIIGECDNAQQMIRDIKNAWDLSTFPMYGDRPIDPLYYWQLQGYMELWGLNKSELIYCLVNTPETLITDEKFMVARQAGLLNLPDDLEQEIELSMTFDDIPKELRTRSFFVERNQDDIDLLYDCVKTSRSYMNKLSLELAQRL